MILSEKRRDLGQRLRSERERLGYDLDALEMKTKIRKRYLGALEDGDWDILPGDVYARGFIRSYAEAVGLDGRTLLDELDRETSTSYDGSNRNAVENSVGEKESVADNGSRDKIASTPRATERPRTSRTTKPIKVRKSGRAIRANAGQAALVIGMLAVLGVGWYLVHGWSSGDTHQPIHNPLATGNTDTSQNSGSAGANDSGNTPSNAVDNAVGASTPGANQTNNTTGDKGANPTPVQVVQQPGQSGSALSYAVTTSDPLKVQVTPVSGPCWVSVTGDNHTIDGSDTIQVNTPKTWQASQSITIYFGHLNGVSITVNGQPVSIPSMNNPTHVTFNKAQTH